MLPTTTLKSLSFEEALAHLDTEAAFVDLRYTASYLEVHIPGSLGLLYEFGPGMASRARDCLPLDLPLILLTTAQAHMGNAAAALRGKGFTVLGEVADGIDRWVASRGAPASTDVVRQPDAPEGTLLDVADPGARRPRGALRIPVDKLWMRAGEVAQRAPIVIVSGYGVRAALAVGMLERCGQRDITFWDTRA